MRNLGLKYKFVHKDKNGNIKYDSGFLDNHMTNDGVEIMYDVFFREGDAPTGFEIGLAQNNLSQSSSLTDITEVTGTGYSRKTVTRDSTASGFETLVLDGGDMQIESVTVQFENTGSTAWDDALDGFMASTGTGTEKLISYRPLSTTRTLQPGDTLDITMQIKGQQPA